MAASKISGGTSRNVEESERRRSVSFDVRESVDFRAWTVHVRVDERMHLQFFAFARLIVEFQIAVCIGMFVRPENQSIHERLHESHRF